jgi:hypothetical protein
MLVSLDKLMEPWHKTTGGRPIISRKESGNRIPAAPSHFRIADGFFRINSDDNSDELLRSEISG